ncbi:tetratricopeptide repeat protein [Pseudorhodoferax sp. Leaf267]|uniref:tetratricopeptide repeat protein n=1 Tax=Pseudorhodoferax sp. Leaf267 TaxID=1736316 RepID=UPI0006FD9995
MNQPADALARARALFLQGVELLESDRADAAETQFEAALQLAPGRPSVLVNLGVARLRLGRPADALAPLDEAVAAEPDQPDTWCHRGLALAALEREAQALASFERALAVDAGHAAARFQQALSLNRLRRHDAALAALQTLLAQHPGLAPAWQLQGQTLQSLERHAEALPAYQRAVTLDQALGEAWSLLGQLHKDAGQREAARHAFERAIAAGADAALNAYFLAALDGRDAPAAAPDAYVRGLFDHYADDFEPHLLDVLHYRAHEAVVQAAAPLCAAPLASALDLGCGTGLCGPLLRPLAAHLEGVDLSPTMLARAEARHCYDALVQADIAEHLRNTPRRHGLVVATDVFIYVGDLAPVFAGVQRVLEPGGVFAFSVESHDGAGFVLRPSLRYAHAEPYLRTLAEAHGLRVEHLQPTILREDQRQPIAGLVVCLRAT